MRNLTEESRERSAGGRNRISHQAPMGEGDHTSPHPFFRGDHVFSYRTSAHPRLILCDHQFAMYGNFMDTQGSVVTKIKNL
jgi:hypothetical protein